eukprot:47050-Rhodomonas_salina.2
MFVNVQCYSKVEHVLGGPGQCLKREPGTQSGSGIPLLCLRSCIPLHQLCAGQLVSCPEVSSFAGYKLSSQCRTRKATIGWTATKV